MKFVLQIVLIYFKILLTTQISEKLFFKQKINEKK
jgi:hypothetical protein